MPLHLYLSPHLDDAVLSCGGLIARQARAGERVVVLTVFAGDPEPGERSPFAEELVVRWQGADPVAERRAEDRAALTLLGATPVHWEYADCVFRHDPRSGASLYPSRDAIFGEVHGHERDALVGELAGRLAALFRAERPVAVYSLLTAGHHVDHQVLQAAAKEAWGRAAGEGERTAEEGERTAKAVTTKAKAKAGEGLRYYEDYPYVEDPAVVRAALAAAGGAWEAELEPLPNWALAAKIEAIACYRSQMSSFFAGLDEMRRRVRAFALSHTPDGPVERYWRPLPADEERR